MTTPLPVRRAHELDAQAPEHRWLIEELWATEAVGIVGGEPVPPRPHGTRAALRG